MVQVSLYVTLHKFKCIPRGILVSSNDTSRGILLAECDQCLGKASDPNVTEAGGVIVA